MALTINGIAYPLTTGSAFSYASIELNMAGQTFTAFEDINYGRKRTREFVRGAHPDPLSKTVGENEYNCSVTLEVLEWFFWLEQLGSGYGDAFFDISVIYNSPQLGVVQDDVIGCTIDEVTAALKRGPSPLHKKIDLRPLKVLEDGLDDCAVPLVGLQSTGLGQSSVGAGSGSLAA